MVVLITFFSLLFFIDFLPKMADHVRGVGIRVASGVLPCADMSGASCIQLIHDYKHLTNDIVINLEQIVYLDFCPASEIAPILTAGHTQCGLM